MHVRTRVPLAVGVAAIMVAAGLQVASAPGALARPSHGARSFSLSPANLTRVPHHAYGGGRAQSLQLQRSGRDVAFVTPSQARVPRSDGQQVRAESAIAPAVLAPAAPVRVGSTTRSTGPVPLALSSATSQSAGPGEWAVGNHDLARTGDASWDQVLSTPLHTVWTGNISDKVQTNPAVVDDVAFFGGANTNHGVYAVDEQSGTMRWTTQLGGSVLSSPAVANGIVYFGGADGVLYALSTSDGSLKFSYPSSGTVGTIVGATAVDNGVVFFGSLDGNVYAVDASTGALIWKATSPGPISAGLTVTNGVVLATSYGNRYVTAYVEQTGQQLWTRHLNDLGQANAVGTAAAVYNGTAYLTSLDGKMYVIAVTTGTDVIAPVSTVVAAQDTPVVVPSVGSVFVGNNAGQVFAFDLSGNPKWLNTLPNSAGISSPIYAAGNVFAASTDGTLYAMDGTTGKGVWGFTTTGALYAPPSIASDHLLIGSDDTHLYGLGPGTPAAGTFAVPTLGHRYGLHSDEIYAYDPVSTSTGNYTYSARDVRWSGRGLATALDRAYNGLDAATNGPFGFGWTDAYHITLIAGTGTQTVRWGDGHQDFYQANANGTFTGPPDTHDQLTTTTGGYQLVTADRRTLAFNTGGALQTIADAVGNTTTLTYDATGRLTAVTDASGRSLTYSYNSAGLISTVAGLLSRVTLYGYDVAGNLSSVTDAAGATTTYAYDSAHHLTDITGPDTNLIIHNVYDASGRVTAQTDAVGGHWGYTYAATTTTVTDPLGNNTIYTFDSDYRTTAVQTPDGATQKFTFDSQSNLIATTQPDGTILHRAYDSTGHVLFSTDASGHGVRRNYDAAGNLIALENAKGATATFTYDGVGEPTSATSPLGVRQSFTYDRGLVATITDAAGGLTHYGYDGNGAATSSTDPLGRTSAVVNDATGAPLTATDPAGNKTSDAYDPDGRLVTVTDALGHLTKYSYTGSGQLNTTSDPNGHVTTYGYDARGLLTSITDPLQRSVHYGYDLNRQVTSYTNARNQTLAWTRDAMERITGRTGTGLAPVSFTYDPNGRPTSMTDAFGLSTYGYNPAGQLVNEHEPYTPGYDLATTYDGVGRRISLTATQSGNTTPYAHQQFSHDADGHTVAVTDTAGGTTQQSYDSAGRLSTITHPNYSELITAYTYDAASQITQVANTQPITAAPVATSQLSTWNYTYDAAGHRNKIVRTLTAGTTSGPNYTNSYSYDPVGRLTNAVSDDPTAPTDANATFAYDPNGNRIQRTISGQLPTSSAYDSADELVSDGTNSYAYDADGNLTTTSVTGTALATSTNTFDALNEVTSTATAAASTSFGYDGLGRRSLLGDPTTGINVIFDGNRPFTENGQATFTADTWADGRQLNRIVANTNSIQALAPDAQGNVGEVSAPEKGIRTARYSYGPFGSSLGPTGTLTLEPGVNPAAYSGVNGVRTQTPTLLSMPARMYQPDSGRFLSRDPYPGQLGQPSTLNRYAYALNDPTDLNDPTGLCGLWSCLATVGKYVGYTALAVGAVVVIVAAPEVVAAAIVGDGALVAGGVTVAGDTALLGTLTTTSTILGGVGLTIQGATTLHDCVLGGEGQACASDAVNFGLGVIDLGTTALRPGQEISNAFIDLGFDQLERRFEYSGGATRDPGATPLPGGVTDPWTGLIGHSK
jgi:RHS repeat-associated protein